MLRLNRATLATLALSALVASGCVTNTRPLSDAYTSQPDLRLLGEWEWQEEKADGSTETIRFIVQRNQGLPNVLELVGNDGDKEERLELFLTKVGDDYFASVADRKANGSPAYHLGKYEVSEHGSATVWALDVDFFAAAVKEGGLKGASTRHFKEVKLNDSPENIRKFVEKYGAKCYSRKPTQVVTRISTPPAGSAASVAPVIRTKAADFAAPPDARQLCDEHISATHTHITWTSWAVMASPSGVVDVYVRRYGTPNPPGDGKHLEVRNERGDILTINPAAEIDTRPHCGNAPRPDEPTVVMISHFTAPGRSNSP